MKTPLISQMRYSQADQTPHSHYHLSCEMVFVSAGAAEFVIDGKSYVAEENSLVFISSYEQHEVRVRRRPYRRYFAMVQAAEVERAFPSSPLPGIFQNRPQGFSHCVSLGGAAPEPERLFARLLAEWDSPAPYGEPMVRALLEEVLIHVYRACPQNFAPLETGAAGSVREVQRYIESHFAEDLRISDLAKAFYMNHCYMTHLFKKQVGYSPKQYLLLNRLSYAQELLENSDLPVSQIAFQCGFGDANNFIRAFRESFGLSPSQFRQREGRRP